jgi:hypothetical protein
MADIDARAATIEVLTTEGVIFSAGGRLPLAPDEALGVWQRLVEEEDVLVPGPDTSWPDGSPGTAHVLDPDLVRRRSRGNDALTLTLVVLTSRGGGTADDVFAVDEALAIYQLLVDEHRVLVPAASTYYPHQWPTERSC